jgi:hypothetical protein
MAASDGQTIWTFRAGGQATRMDGMVRKHLGAGWRPDPPQRGRVIRKRSNEGARHLLQFIGALFAFYGVVFGAGSIARDRDEGTFEAELATALPVWVHGAARWIAGSVLLSVFYAFSVFVFDAFLGVPGPISLVAHGAAACAGATAIGILVIGRAGLESGFAAPMSLGLVAVVSLLSTGLSWKTGGALLPIASLLTDDPSGLGALAMSLVWGLIAVAVFTRRSTIT